jgi:hypothetical protein
MIAYQALPQEIAASGNFGVLRRSRPGKALATRIRAPMPPLRTPRPIPLRRLRRARRSRRATTEHTDGHNRRYASNEAKPTIPGFTYSAAQRTTERGHCIGNTARLPMRAAGFSAGGCARRRCAACSQLRDCPADPLRLTPEKRVVEQAQRLARYSARSSPSMAL